MAKRIKPAVLWGVRDEDRVWFGVAQYKQTAQAIWKGRGRKVIRVAIVPLADAVRAGLVTANEARAK